MKVRKDIRKLQQRFTVSILHEVVCFTLRPTSPPPILFLSIVKVVTSPVSPFSATDWSPQLINYNKL